MLCLAQEEKIEFFEHEKKEHRQGKAECLHTLGNPLVGLMSDRMLRRVTRVIVGNERDAMTAAGSSLALGKAGK